MHAWALNAYLYSDISRHHSWHAFDCCLFHSGNSQAPANVHYVVNYSHTRELNFFWDPVSVANCPSVEYIIDASEGCGECPLSTFENMVKCINFKEQKLCTFSVLTEVCGIITQSEALNVSSTAAPTGSQTSLGKLSYFWLKVLWFYVASWQTDTCTHATL